MLFNSPIGSEKADRLVELLQLNPDSRVLDVGCGTGEFLIRIAERYRCHGVGVDTDPASLNAARDASSAWSMLRKRSLISSMTTRFVFDMIVLGQFVSDLG